MKPRTKINFGTYPIYPMFGRQLEFLKWFQTTYENNIYKVELQRIIKNEFYNIDDIVMLNNVRRISKREFIKDTKK